MRKFTVLCIASLLAFSAVGCSAEVPAQGNNEEITTAAAESSDTDTTAASDAETTAAETTEAAETEEEELDYSYMLDDDGYVTGVKALDYITLPDFNDYVFDKSEIEPSDDEMETLIENICSRYETEVTDRAVEDGDTVNIDYVGHLGTADGETFDGGDTQGNGTDVTIGVTSYIDDFLEQLIGHAPGETINVEVTFPDPYTNNEDLSGKDAVFVTTINYITESPEFDDDMVQANSEDLNSFLGSEGLTTAEEVRAFLVDSYAEYNLETAIQDRIGEDAAEAEVPDNAREYAVNTIRIQIKNYYGCTYDEFMSYYGLTEDDMEEDILSAARNQMFIQAIAEDQGFEATDEKLQELVGDDLDSVIETYGRGYLAAYVQYEMAMDYIKSFATYE